jgi:hypothetical protein
VNAEGDSLHHAAERCEEKDDHPYEKEDHPHEIAHATPAAAADLRGRGLPPPTTQRRPKTAHPEQESAAAKAGA